MGQPLIDSNLMSQIGEIIGMNMQERVERESAAIMDGGDRVVRRKSLQEWLGLGCCGSTLGFGPPSITVRDEDEEEGPHQEVIDVGQTSPELISGHDCVGQAPASSGMNLAAALAAERNLRAAQDSDGLELSPIELIGNGPNGPNRPSNVTSPGTPLRMSLMRLLEETDGVDGEREKEERKGEVGGDSVCCVCMGRKKGAAFIPCGHTFCRVCSRELWLNRGFCPICNRSIVEILDIF